MTDSAAGARDAKEIRFVLPILVLMRIAIGWHLLYEGLVKLFPWNWTAQVLSGLPAEPVATVKSLFANLVDPAWTAAPFLAQADGALGGFFQYVLAHDAALRAVDLLNVYGLIFIGLGLLLGCFSRTASFFGAVLLGLYYLADPPLITTPSATSEGSYLLVNKNFIVVLALVSLTLVPTGRAFGLDGLVAYYRARRKAAGPKPAKSFAEAQAAKAKMSSEALPTPPPIPARRQLLKHLATLPLLGGFIYAYVKKFGWESYEERHLLTKLDNRTDGASGATVKAFQFAELKDLEGTLGKGKIGDLEISRLFLGGNLIGGWAHARDLIYVNKLIKSYHSDQKIFDTLRLAEKCGVNTLLTNPQLGRVINAYWHREGGTIQFISDCGYQGNAVEGARVSIDAGAHACYVQGAIADNAVRDGKMDRIAEALELIRKNGLPAGIGAHHLETVQACVELGLKPDFWVKTLHHIDYWSADKENEHDNIWCVDPKETIAYMEALEEPWVAFKTLAAGAIHPEVGFEYAFQNGADFVCAGMYDFQVVDDVNIASKILAKGIQRNRPWCA